MYDYCILETIGEKISSFDLTENQTVKYHTHIYLHSAGFQCSLPSRVVVVNIGMMLSK